MNNDQPYLLDTCIISDLVRNPQGIVFDWIKEVGEELINTSIVVVSELRFGVQKKGSQRLKIQLAEILDVIRILPLKSPVDHEYAELRTYLEKTGQPIGPNDMLIAAHARALNFTLVSANMKEFSRIPKLRLENWLTS